MSTDKNDYFEGLILGPPDRAYEPYDDPYDDYGEFEPVSWKYVCKCRKFRTLGWCLHYRYTTELDVKEEYL